jgi:hypothetical protein
MMHAALFLAAAVLESAAGTVRAPCPAVTAIDGPAADVRRLTSVLNTRRIGVGTSPECGGVGAYVRLSRREDGSGYVVVVDDRYGRRVRRAVEDPEAAASIVESWTTEEEADLPGSSTAPPAQATVLSTAQVSAAPSAPRVHSGFAVSLEAALGSDRSLWYGGSGGACLAVGIACVGAKARIMVNRAANQLDTDAGPASRERFDLLLTAALPWSRGRLTMVPAAAMGAGWVRTSASGADGQTSYEDGGGLRADLDVDLLFRVSSSFSLSTDVGATWVFLSRTGARVVDGIFFPGEPGATFHLGIGGAFTP